MAFRWMDSDAPLERMDVAPAGPGDRTDRFALPGASEYVPRHGYLVVRTPERPDHAHGHRLILAEPPEPGSLAQWLLTWRREHAGRATCDVAVLQFEAPTLQDVRRTAPPLTLWLRCMRIDEVPPAAAIETRIETTSRPLDPDRDDDWQSAVVLSVATNGVDADLTEWIYADWRARVREGRGLLHGLFHRQRLVGACAVFWREGEARFQDVSIHPGFQQLGLGGHLIREALAATFARGDVHRAWLVCQQDSHAERLYRRLGFTPESELGEIAVAVRPPSAPSVGLGDEALQRAGIR